MSAMIKFSARTRCAIRHREAPSAAMTAISRRRASARARTRFATFEQAINSTRPTATISAWRAGRIGATAPSCSDRKTIPCGMFVSDALAWAWRRAMVSI